MIVYVKEAGVLGVVVSEFNSGYVIEWYVDGMNHQEFLLREEFIVYENGGLDDDN